MAATTAPNASAVEVVNEATGAHCDAPVVEAASGPPQISGGCPIRAAGQLEVGVGFGMGICDISIEGRFDETGHLIGAWSCSQTGIAPCLDQRHLELRITGDSDPAGTWPMELEFCWAVPNTFPPHIECHIFGRLVEAGPHDYRWEVGGGGFHAKCANQVYSLMGELDLVYDEEHPEIEILD